MRLSIFTLILTVLLFGADPARAQDSDHFSVGIMLRNCEFTIVALSPRISTLNELQLSRANTCVSFFNGFVQSHELLSNVLKLFPPVWCTPDQVTIAQYVRIYNKWANSRPDRHHRRAVVDMTLAFKQTFPCAK